MDEPSEPDEPASGHTRRASAPLLRTAVLLAVFVLVTSVALGKLHGTTAGSAAGTVAATATSTTAPPHASTTTTTTRPPSTVPVLVANATGVGGAAGNVTNQLQAAGWSMQPPVNASARVPSSHVYYVAGRQQQADAIALALHLPSTAVAAYTTAAPISSIGTAEVVVVVGPDLAGTTTTTT